MDGETLKKTQDEILRRIIATAAPVKVILFGSAALGTMGPDSDFDFLVVVPDGVHRRKTAQAVYRALFGIGFAADIVVVTEGDMDRYSDDPGFIIQPAVKEGTVVYAAA